MSEQARKRRVYLRMLTVDEARAKLIEGLAAVRECETEIVPTTEALGRVTAEPVFARGSSPHYCAAAMDGFAVQSKLTARANETHPVAIPIPQGAVPINTGDMMPEGFDAVVMIEDVHQPDPHAIEIRAAVSPWQHVRLLGEDIVATELVVPPRRRLTPADVGALIASQVWEVPVVRRPRVVFLPTGSEVIRPGNAVRPGEVIDYNSYMLASLIEEWGGVATIEPPTPDDPTALRNALMRGVAEYDLVAFIAGSSAGSHDFVPNLIEELGDLLCHGVRLAPGKPTAIGVVDGTPVLGVPGYSVAAWTAFDLFAKPIVAWLQGLTEQRRPTIEARVRQKVPSKAGTREYLRVRVGRVGSEVVAIPLKRGAGTISSLVQADGLAIVPDMDEGLDPSATVEVELLVPAAAVERTILVVGSHDLALDLLECHLSGNPEGIRLASVHVGSMGGLRALAQREAHLAGTHLLDPATEEYNVPYIKRILPEMHLKLINLAYREVGLMVLPGNPKGILGLNDLAREDVVIINRQRGAGTRILLDHLLRRNGLEPGAIRGYEREVTTHTMVAAAIVGGTADTGLGIRAAAKALGLEFVPIASERYDLAIPQEHFNHPGVQQILQTVRSEPFRRAVLELGGYDLSHSGSLMYEQ